MARRLYHPLRFPRRHNQSLSKSVLPNSLTLENAKLENLLFDDFFNRAIHESQQKWRDVVAEAARLGIPCPAFSTALSWFDGYRTARLPAALLQAQRDYFGAHTFRVLPDQGSETLPVGKDVHINWTGRGGNVSASSYQA